MANTLITENEARHLLRCDKEEARAYLKDVATSLVRTHYLNTAGAQWAVCERFKFDSHGGLKQGVPSDG